MGNLKKTLVLNLLNNNGVNKEYLEDMEGIESGSSEWMGILSELLNKDVYVEEISDEENEVVMELIGYLYNELNIDFV